MSDVLAIAGVTTVLRDMLANRYAADPVAAAVGPVALSSGPPDRVDLSGASDPTQVNIFFHQASRNTGWVNEGAPVRAPGGERTAAPPLALDLHYLITAYGADELHAEILIAQAAQVFHETPVPPRAAIRGALAPAVPPAGFPAALAQSGLADQVESLRITPEAMSNEEISKLWTALQARYRPTLAVKVTTVLIDSDLAVRRALPARGALAVASAAQRPRIDAVRPAAGRLEPVLPGTEIAVTGSGLAADAFTLRVGDADLTATITEAGPARIVFALPDPLPAGLRAGAQPVVIAHSTELGEPPVARETAVSSPGILVIQPQATAAFAQSAERVVDGTTYHDGTVTLALTPPAGRDQRVGLALNATDGSGRGYAFRAPDGNGLAATTAETASVEVPVTNVAAGSYLFRVQVDAGESPLARAADGSFTGPTVTI